jgi:hypothetical protein
MLGRRLQSRDAFGVLGPGNIDGIARDVVSPVTKEGELAVAVTAAGATEVNGTELVPAKLTVGISCRVPLGGIEPNGHGPGPPDGGMRAFTALSTAVSIRVARSEGRTHSPSPAPSREVLVSPSDIVTD